jgi:hypothetical protein
MNVGIPHKVLDYWRQLKREYTQEKWVGHLAGCAPRTLWTDLDSRYYRKMVRWRWIDAPTLLSSKPQADADVECTRDVKLSSGQRKPGSAFIMVASPSP